MDTAKKFLLTTAILLSLTIIVSYVSINKSNTDKKNKLINELKKENERLTNIIINLQETDQSYFNRAIDLIDKSEFDKAIINLESLKKKFPYSKLIHKANSQIKIAKKKIEQEKKQKETNALLEAEAKTGIKITSIKSSWKIRSGLGGNELLSPSLMIKLKNIGNKNIKRLFIKADFVKGNKEIFGEGTDYLIGSSDTPLKPGYSKTAFIYSNIGFTSFFADLPSLSAEIYINDIYIKKTWVSKKKDIPLY